MDPNFPGYDYIASQILALEAKEFATYLDQLLLYDIDKGFEIILKYQKDIDPTNILQSLSQHPTYVKRYLEFTVKTKDCTVSLITFIYNLRSAKSASNFLKSTATKCFCWEHLLIYSKVVI